MKVRVRCEGTSNISRVQHYQKCTNEGRVKLRVTQEKMALRIVMFSQRRQPTCVDPAGREPQHNFPNLFFILQISYWSSPLV